MAVQFATPEAVCSGSLAVATLTSWWGHHGDDSTTVIVHGGQAEIKFCVQMCGRIPKKLMIFRCRRLRGRSYPLSYSRSWNESSENEWPVIRREPIGCVVRFRRTDSYALEDAAFLPEIWESEQVPGILRPSSVGLCGI